MNVSGFFLSVHHGGGPGVKSGGDSFEHGRMLHELQTTKKQLNEAVKKVDQAMKDADYYHGEAENMRGRYNDILLDKQRLEQVISKYSKKSICSGDIRHTQFLFVLCRLILDVFPQLSPTQVGKTLSFSKKSLSLFKKWNFF